MTTKKESAEVKAPVAPIAEVVGAAKPETKSKAKKKSAVQWWLAEIIEQENQKKKETN